MMSNELYLTLVYRPNVSRVSRALQSTQRSREALAAAQVDALRVMGAAQVPSGKIYTAADIVSDAQFIAREMIKTIELPDGTPLKVPGIVPKLSETPGDLGQLSPALGAHTEEVLRGIGITDQQIAQMRERGVI